MKKIKTYLELTSILSNIFLIFFRIFAIRPRPSKTGWMSSVIVEDLPIMYLPLIVILVVSAYFCSKRAGMIEANYSEAVMNTPEILRKLVINDVLSLIPICFVMAMIIDSLHDASDLFLFSITALVDSFKFYFIAVAIKSASFDFPYALLMPSMTEYYAKLRKQQEDMEKLNKEIRVTDLDNIFNNKNNNGGINNGSNNEQGTDHGSDTTS